MVIRKQIVMHGTIFATAVGSLLLSSCSAASEQRPSLPTALCETNISTSSLQEMYPGPYSDLAMIPSKGGGIKALKKSKGGTKAECDIWITQEKGDTFTLVGVVVDLHPQSSVDDLFKRYEKWYPDHRQQPLTLGAAKGFTMHNASLLVFNCQELKKGTSAKRALGVSVRVTLPEYPNGPGVDRAELAKGAAKLAADTARYVSSDVLQCSGPRLPGGPPAQEPPPPGPEGERIY